MKLFPKASLTLSYIYIDNERIRLTGQLERSPNSYNTAKGLADMEIFLSDIKKDIYEHR